MGELNKLTQRLFAVGWTKENHPDYVRDWTYQSMFYGGFEYTREKKDSMVFSTPCGLLIKGSYWNSGSMSYRGIDWTMENDNPTIRCPYRKVGCRLNHPLLRDSPIGGGADSIMVECACHEVPDAYDYNRSWDIIEAEEQAVQEDLFQMFAKQMNGRVCREQCRFDRKKQQWQQIYDPIRVCARQRCSFCTVLQKELSRSRGNVFYDVKISTKKSGEGFFPDEYPVRIIKGKKFLEHPASLDICTVIAEQFQSEIIGKEEERYSRELFFAKNHDRYFKLEVLNIRAASRERRDAEQDTADEQAGSIVVHKQDMDAAVKAQKRARREKNLQDRIRKHLQNITCKGLSGLEAIDQIRIDRLIERGLLSREEVDAAQKEFERRQSIEQIQFLI